MHVQGGVGGSTSSESMHNLSGMSANETYGIPHVSQIRLPGDPRSGRRHALDLERRPDPSRASSYRQRGRISRDLVPRREHDDDVIVFTRRVRPERGRAPERARAVTRAQFRAITAGENVLDNEIERFYQVVALPGMRLTDSTWTKEFHDGKITMQRARKLRDYITRKLPRRLLAEEYLDRYDDIDAAYDARMEAFRREMHNEPAPKAKPRGRPPLLPPPPPAPVPPPANPAPPAPPPSDSTEWTLNSDFIATRRRPPPPPERVLGDDFHSARGSSDRTNELDIWHSAGSSAGSLAEELRTPAPPPRNIDPATGERPPDVRRGPEAPPTGHTPEVVVERTRPSPAPEGSPFAAAVDALLAAGEEEAPAARRPAPDQIDTRVQRQRIFDDLRGAHVANGTFDRAAQVRRAAAVDATITPRRGVDMPIRDMFSENFDLIGEVRGPDAARTAAYQQALRAGYAQHAYEEALRQGFTPR